MKTQAQNVMVSISLIEGMSGDLLKLGLPEVFRTTEEQDALTALYEEHAATDTPSRDVYRFNRTDASGNTQADGGEAIFKETGQKNVTPINLAMSLEKNGFHLAVAEIFRAEGNGRNFKLRLTWSVNSLARVTLTEQQLVVIDKYLCQAYFKLFGYRNQENISLTLETNPIQGTITTLNFSGLMDIKKSKDQDIREIQLTDKDGHFRCPVSWPAPSVHRCPEKTTDRLVNASPEEAFDHGVNAGK